MQELDLERAKMPDSPREANANLAYSDCSSDITVKWYLDIDLGRLERLYSIASSYQDF